MPPNVFFYFHPGPEGGRVSPTFEYELRRGVMDGASRAGARLFIGGPEFDLDGMLEGGAWREWDCALGTVPAWAREHVRAWDRLQAKLPAITLTGASRIPRGHRIDSDDDAALSQILGHLDALGFGRVGYLGMDSGHHADSRYRAFLRASSRGPFTVAVPHVASACGAARRRHPLPLRLRDLALPANDPRYLPAAVDATRSWLVGIRAHLPRAIVCESDRVAWILWQACGQAGIPVPEGLALTGIDDQAVDFAPWGYNILTTVRQDFAAIGRLGVELALDLARSKKPRRRMAVRCPGTLVVRRSTCLPGAPPLPETFRARASAHLRADFAEHDCARSLSSALGLDPAALRLKFRREFGTTLARHVCALRIERSRFLLTHSAKPIAAIWAEVGFRSHQHFLRNFRVETGMSPLRWRQKYG